MTINQGSIISIRGSVVDVRFLKHLPEPNNLLKTGTNQRVALEVVTYLSSEIVRTIALNPTQGLARGSTVIDTGHPLQVQSERNIVYRARRLERFLTQPFFTTEQFTGLEGRMVKLEEALDGCDRILNDEFSNVSEQSLYMIGGVNEIKNKLN